MIKKLLPYDVMHKINQMVHINKHLHDILGNCWHEWEFKLRIPISAYKCLKCGKFVSGIKPNDPDYCGDPGLVLREMKKRDDWTEFRDSIGGWKTPYEFVRIDLMLDITGKLAQLAIDWIEERKEL